MYHFLRRGVASALLVLGVVASTLGVLPGGVSAQANTISFTRSVLQGETNAAPTAIEFGPDGKLYVADVDGTIKVYEIQKNGPNDYQVTSTETITRVRDIPNHDDDGTLTTDPEASGKRQVTGIRVGGTAQNPILYVSNSDPRIGEQFENTPLDTNSGIVSRLTQTTPGTWAGAAKIDLVRGLPRNEENHSVNGMELSTDGNTMYLAVGGNTNSGAPSSSFAFQWEYALSAAILNIDLAAIDALPLQPAGCDPTLDDCFLYDVPTLDDPTRPNVGATSVDVGDPFGGNSDNGGANQARLVPGGPVQLHAVGFRNAYDVILASDGRMYSIDNGANNGWGGPPGNEGPAGVCDNSINNAGATRPDALHYIRELNPGEMYYAGHPNPLRGNPDDIFASTQGTAVPWSESPVPIAQTYAVECDFRAAPGNGELETWLHSTNGMAEYTASNFGGAMQGDILAAGWSSNSVVRVKLSFDGSDNPTVVESDKPLSSAGFPLDVEARGDAETFPGTVWVAQFFGSIEIFEPDENVVCGGPPGADDDSDGYTNSDEIDNGSDPCSAASVPDDADGDFVSDLNDPDDDNDGTPDVSDPFAIDADNGLDNSVPVDLQWESPTEGILGLGFTGLMNNGTDTWSDQYDENQITAIGAAGVMTVDDIGSGTALGTANDQRYAFQLGVDPCGACTAYRVTTEITSPLQNIGTPTTESIGVFAGTGDQSNYVKAVVTPGPTGNGGIQLLVEENDVVTSDVFTPAPAVLTGGLVDVSIDIDPGNGTATASYRVDGGAEVAAGGPVPVPAGWSTGGAAVAVGVIGSSGGAPAFGGTWNSLQVLPVAGTGTGSWTQLQAASEARHENSMVEVNNKIYLIGGRGTRSVEVYDPSTDTWSSATPPPIQMHHFQAVSHNDLIYVVGGMTGNFPSETPLANVYIYDPNDDRWIEGPEIPTNRRRGSGGVVVYNDLIYFVGGIQNGHQSGTVGWTDVFDPATGVWTALPNDMPNPRDHFSAALVGDKIYVAGGRITSTGDTFGNTITAVDVYDITTGNWTTLADPIPTERAASSVGVLGTEVLVAGGESGSTVNAHNEVEALDTVTETWRSVAPLPTNEDRHGTGAVVIDCRLYVAAGSGSRGGSPELSSTLSFEFGSCPIPVPAGGSLTASPSPVAFGTVPVGSSSTIDVTISNPGGSVLTISEAGIIGGDAGEFSAGGSYPLQVPAGGSVTVPVTYNPTLEETVGAPDNFGDTSAALAVVHDGGNSAVTVPLSGTGGEPGADQPISGLTVTTNGPVILGGPTTATASVFSGTNISYDWDMGDGTTFTDAGASVSHTYAAAGTYTVSVTASNSVSTETASTATVVQDPPVGSQILINSGGPSYQDNLGRTWSADTNFAGGNTYSRGVAIDGTTNDTLYQSERYGNFGYDIPVPGAGCYDVTVHFAELWFGSRGGGGDGSRVFSMDLEQIEVLVNYDIHAAVGPLTATSETYQIQLADSVVDLDFTSQVNNAKVSGVEITPAGGTCGADDPIAGLTLSNDGPTPLGSPTGFSAAITGGTNVTYDWDFGDGTTVSDGGTSQSHTYTSMGTYTATVTATNSVSNETATSEVTVTNTGDSPITGLAAGNDGPTALGSATGFNATVTGGTNITYDWDFGDGTTVNDAGPNPSHTYGSLGSYTATVTATNSVGSDTATTSVTVENAPVAGLSVSSAGPVEVGVPASLTATVTGGTNLTYDWDFGDGTTLDDGGPSVTHSYGSAGSYTVSVTASNDVSTDTATATQTVTSGPDDPIAGLSVSSGGPVTLGNPSSFTASITGGTNVVYNWDFGDGTTVNDGGATIDHTYASIGSYTVTVTAVNGVSSESASTAASVTDEPIAGLSVSNNGPVLLGGPIALTASVTAGTDVTYDWDLGDGTILNDAGTSVNHTYGAEGSYVVTVTATNPVSSDTASDIAVVQTAPAFTYRVNSGGGSYTDGASQVWQADADFVGGSTYGRGAPIAGTSDDTLYQSERYGNFSYSIPVPVVACYDVTLHFAELWFGSRGGGGDGSRVFDVDIEGSQVLGAYDIHADVGPLAAATQTFPVQVVDPTLDIAFTSVVNNAKVSAVEVVLSGSSCDPDDPITGLSASNDGPTEAGSPTQLLATIGGGSNITYNWDLGDGTILLDAGPSLAHTYTSAGSYTATVTASNNASTETASTTVTVTAAPDDPITGLAVSNNGPTALGSPTGFTASVTGGTNVVYDWDFGDGTTVTDGGPSVTHTYGSVGSFTATVTARNSGSPESASTTAQVDDVAIAGLSAASGGSVVIGNPANLTATITAGTNVTYDWDFGDGNSVSDAGSSVSHTYGSTGSYTVTVTATNSAGSDTATATQVVTDQPDDPITGLSVSSGGPVNLGDPSGFTASITGGTNVTYNWDFGDGTTLNDGGTSVNHTYATPGSYTVTVTAVNGVSSDNASTVGTVNDTAIAGLSASNDGPVAVGGTVGLTASVTAGTNITYDWDLGDGTTLTDAGPTVSHTYGTIGSYVATVTATNTAGTDSATTTVVVDNVPVAGLAITPDASLFVNTPAAFTATVTAGTGLSYDWDFGDGTTLTNTGSSVTHTYSSAGNYTVSVTATNSVSSETATVNVVVDNQPSFEVLINSGGAAYVDSTSRTWAADNAFVGGRSYTRTVAIANTVDDPLYQTERYGNFGYAIPVPNAGCYRTSLHMAELWWGSPPAGGGDGNRVFDVSIEGNLVLDDHDIHAATGPRTAMVLTFDQVVSDGTLDIQFQTVVNNAKISAVEVQRIGSSCS